MAYFTKEADSDGEYKNTNLTEKIFTDKLFIINLLPVWKQTVFRGASGEVSCKVASADSFSRKRLISAA